MTSPTTINIHNEKIATNYSHSKNNKEELLLSNKFGNSWCELKRGYLYAKLPEHKQGILPSLVYGKGGTSNGSCTL